MFLITETNLDNVNLIKEDNTVEGQPSNYFIEGIFMQSEKKNKNGRNYPKNILMKEVKRYNKEFVNNKRALGELGHPEGPTVNLDRVSHMITELREDGNDVYGRAKIMNTPMGKIVKNLIDEGANIGVSSRGMGSLKKNKKGVNEVQDDFILATIDIVSDPSAPDAYVNGIMEGKEWVWDNGILKAQDVECHKKLIESAVSKSEREDRMLYSFIDLLSKM